MAEHLVTGWGAHEPVRDSVLCRFLPVLRFTLLVRPPGG
jgi:hypothetical protein